MSNVIKKMVIASMFMGTLIVSLSTKQPFVTAGSEALADWPQCQDACTKGEKSCWDIPSGTSRTDCFNLVYSTFAGCCVAAGRKAPSPGSCICG